MIVADARTLVLMLHSPEPSVCVQACEAILNFADEQPGNRLELLKLGALNPLHRMLVGGFFEKYRPGISGSAGGEDGAATGRDAKDGKDKADGGGGGKDGGGGKEGAGEKDKGDSSGGGGGSGGDGSGGGQMSWLEEMLNVKKNSTMCIASLSENNEVRKELRRLGTMKPILTLLRKRGSGSGGGDAGGADGGADKKEGGKGRGKSGSGGGSGGKDRPRTTSGKKGGSHGLHDDGGNGSGRGEDGGSSFDDELAFLAGEDSEFLEYISQTLLNMAGDYAGINEIFRLGGLEDLVFLMSQSGDPDVQKNTVTTVSLLVREYQCRIRMAEINGIEPLISLLDSEYQEIQEEAMTCMAVCAKNYKNRQEMHRLNLLERLIELLDEAYSDVHGKVLRIIANCLQDDESVLQFQKGGGFSELVNILSTSQSAGEVEYAVEAIMMAVHNPNNLAAIDQEGCTGILIKLLAAGGDASTAEGIGFMLGLGGGAGGGGGDGSGDKGGDKGGNEKGGDKGGGGDKGDKGGGSGGDDDEEDEDSIATKHAIVASKAANAVALLATNKQIAASIVDQLDGLPVLIGLLRNSNTPPAQPSSHKDAKGQQQQQSGSGGASPKLTTALVILREKAALALANVTAYTADTKIEAAKCGAIPPLIALLSESSVPTAQANAASALHNLAKDPGNRVEIHEQGGTFALATALMSTNPNVQKSAAQALSECVHDAAVRAALCAPITEEGFAMPTENVDEQQEGETEQTPTTGEEVTVNSTGKSKVLEITAANPMEGSSDVETSGIGLICSLLDSEYTEVRRQAAWCIRMAAVDDETALHVCSYKGLEKLRELSRGGNPIEKFAKAALDKVLNQTLAAKYWLRGVLSAKNRICDRFYDCGQAKKGSKFFALSMLKRFSVDDRRPVMLVDATVDTEFARYVQVVDSPLVKGISDPAEQAEALGKFVSEQMGGPVPRDQLSSFNFELPIADLKIQLQSNVVPIGMIKSGIFYHRGLLFKALADRIGLQCSLVRGEYGRAWNVISIAEEEGELYPSDYLVDLMHVPGRLMKVHSPEAIEYQMLEY